MKKIVRCGLAAALLLTGVTAAQAQISFGPKVGLNLANLSYKYDGDEEGVEDPDMKMIIAPSFGLMMNARFGNLAVQPALTYSIKGGKSEFTYDESQDLGGGDSYSIKGTATTKMTLGYIDVPINLVYTTGGDNGFQVFAGPYVGFGIGGKSKTETDVTVSITSGGQTISSSDKSSEESDVKFKGDVKDGDDEDATYVRPLDFGLNVGLGYMVSNFQIQAGYGLGLAELIPKSEGEESDFTAKNRVIHFTVGYLFGGK